MLNPSDVLSRARALVSDLSTLRAEIGTNGLRESPLAAAQIHADAAAASLLSAIVGEPAAPAPGGFNPEHRG
jgi:hypothetical protein